VAAVRDRRARVATTAIFFATGWVYAAWATRIPAIKHDLALSAGALGLAVLGLEAGAVVGLPAGGALVGRYGSRRALQAGFATYPAALACTALAGSLAALTATLAVMAAATSVVDVAMNAQGIELERRYERPIMSGLHAGHPFGLAIGGVAGTVAAGLAVGVGAHFAAVAATGAALGLTATLWLVDEPRQGRAGFARPSRRLLALGALAFCAFLLDGAAFNWSAVHLREVRHGSAALAAAAFMVFAFAVAFGRLFGDRIAASLGRTGVVRLSGVLAAVGAAGAIAAPTAATTLVGWAILGIGVAALAPTILGAAPGMSDLPAGTAIAAVTTLGYLGSFTGPPLIGAVAERTGLSAALGLLVLAGLTLAALAGLTGQRDRAPSRAYAYGESRPVTDRNRP
jgi:MFS family permease